MNKFYKVIWDFTEDFYRMTGLRIQAPIEVLFPDFGPWLFGKMIGVKGVEQQPFRQTGEKHDR